MIQEECNGIEEVFSNIHNEVIYAHINPGEIYKHNV